MATTENTYPFVHTLYLPNEKTGKWGYVSVYDKTAIHQGEIDELLNTKVDKENGKGLSEQNYTQEEKQKLALLSNYNDAALRNLVNQKIDQSALVTTSNVQQNLANDTQPLSVAAAQALVNAVDLSTYATKSDIENFITGEALNPYAKKSDITDFITNDALTPYAKKSDIAGFITEDALADFVTIDVLNSYATKDDISEFITASALISYATKSDIADFITDDAIKDFITTEALNPYATKDEIANFITAAALTPYATKDELSDFLTADDITDVARKSDLTDFVVQSDLNDFFRTANIQSSLNSATNTAFPPSVQAVNAALNNYATTESLSAKADAADLAQKVDKESGKGLSTNDFTNAYKAAIDNMDFIPNSDKSATLVGNDDKVPTVQAVRAAISAAAQDVTITTDTTFSSTSENPLQNKTITQRIETDTTQTSYSTKLNQLPTIGVVQQIVNTAIANFTTTDENVKMEKNTTQTAPLLMGNISPQSNGSTTTTIFNSDVYYDPSEQVLTVPHITQSQGGNYYIVTGTSTPDNSMPYAEHGLSELYIQYEE